MFGGEAKFTVGGRACPLTAAHQALDVSVQGALAPTILQGGSPLQLSGSGQRGPLCGWPKEEQECTRPRPAVEPALRLQQQPGCCPALQCSCSASFLYCLLTPTGTLWLVGPCTLGPPRLPTIDRADCLERECTLSALQMKAKYAADVPLSPGAAGHGPAGAHSRF